MLCVVIFSGLIYYIGFHLRAGDLEWNELDVVDILPDSDRAVLRGETYVSIYSPINSDYELAGQEKFASLRGEYLGNFGGSQESSRAEIMQTGNNFDAEAYVPVWTSQLLVSDWVQPWPRAIDNDRQPKRRNVDINRRKQIGPPTHQRRCRAGWNIL